MLAFVLVYVFTRCRSCTLVASPLILTLRRSSRRCRRRAKGRDGPTWSRKRNKDRAEARSTTTPFFEMNRTAFFSVRDSTF